MLSIAIVNWNTRDLLRCCLQSIFQSPPEETMEVIVVDNASSDDSAKMVADEFPNVLLIALDRNTGYAHGNNLALARARGEWLLTLNPDTEMQSGTLQTSLEILKQKNSYGALSIRLVGPDGNVQHSIRGWPTIAGLIGDSLGLAKLFPKSKWASYRLPNFDYAKEGPAPQPMGTFLLFRKAALEAIHLSEGAFDERFPIFFNDVDLLKRLDDAGWPCLYSPKATTFHHHGASTRLVRKAMVWESHLSLIRYLWKHSRKLLDRMGVALVTPAIVLAAIVRARGFKAGFRP